MELKESFDNIFNEIEIEDALTCIQNNSQEATKILIEKLQQEIIKLENEQTIAGNSRLNKILELLAMLQATDAFPLFLKILESEVLNTWPNVFGVWLSCVIPNEDTISVLKDYATNQVICEVGRLATCEAVNIFYRNANTHPDLEIFFRDVISTFDSNQFDHGENLSLLFGIIQVGIDLGFTDLLEELKVLIIQLIIKSESGDNASWFKEYFEYLYKLDPLIKVRIHEIKVYIRTMGRCSDKELFQYEDFVSIGKFFFTKTLGAVKDANADTVKMAIKQLRQFPYNNRPQPSTDEEYYEETCFYLGMKKIPKEIYSQAQKLYQDIFKTGYLELREEIEILVNDTKVEQKKLIEESKSIIAKSNGISSIFKDIEGCKSQLVRNYFLRKELDALYKDVPSGRSGLLVFYLKESQRFLDCFCKNAGDLEQADEKLRELSARCAFSDTTEIEDYFSQYRRVVKQLHLLLEKAPLPTLYNIFYNVKFIPFYEKIQEKYRKMGGVLKAEEQDRIIQEMNAELENHPLFPRSLMDCAGRDMEKYHAVLEKFSPEVVSSIREALSNSICLEKRKPLIEHCLRLVEDKEDELTINLLPVHIEGLFADLLEYSTIFEYIGDIGLYQTILRLELAEKIDFGISKDINISFNAVAYFKHYFSSIVRNTVAHGNYALLVESKGIHKGHCYEIEDDDLIKRTLTLELLLDLNYLTHTICEINEIDTAIRYIKYTAEFYMPTGDETEDDRATSYECLFADLNGTRNRFNISGYKSGIFVTYNPVQILHWIFNPFYEKYLDARSLKLIREGICSSKFWKYVENQLETSWNRRFEKTVFQSVVKKMIGIAKSNAQTDEETVDLLKKINNKLNDIPS